VNNFVYNYNPKLVRFIFTISVIMRTEKFLLYLLMCVLAVFSFLFCFYGINPSLHYHYQQIAWQSSKLFLDYNLAFSGGIGEYFTLFISQLFFSKILGSAIVAISGFLISFLIYITIKNQWKNSKLLMLLIPLVQVIVLAPMCDYRYPFSITVNLVIVSGFLFLCTLFAKKTGITISFHTIIAGILLYYISGGMYFLIFMVSSLILLLKKPDGKMLINVVLILSIAILIPFVAYQFIFLTSLNNSYFRSTPDVAAMLRYSRPNLFYIVLAIIPSILLLGRLLTIIPFWEKLLLNNNKLKLAIAAQVFILTMVSGFIIYNSYKPLEKTKIEIDYLASQQNWEKVISMSEQLGSYDRMVNFQFNRALLNTGQVLDKFFDYDQLLGVQGLFLEKPFASEVTLPSSDIYFDLGNIDESQRFAFESETLMKNSPRVLKRLVLNCIIMEKMNAANTYINILAANPMEKDWVKKYREYINNPNLAAADPLILKKRQDMSKTEGISGTPPIKLLNQLKKNPHNKGAFEYLIALDLMEHDLTSLEMDFSFIKDLNYKKLPVVLEEAIIIFKSQGKDNAFLNSVRISESTTNRFREFAKLTSASKGDREKAKQATLAYKNTYWYYVLFLSPKVTKVTLNTQAVEANY